MYQKYDKRFVLKNEMRLFGVHFIEKKPLFF